MTAVQPAGRYGALDIREDNSIASFNDHGNVFYDRFNIAVKDENSRFSGCVGWGYERIIYSILAQKGADFSSDYYKRFNLTI